MSSCVFLRACFVLLLVQFEAVAKSPDTSQKVSADAVPPVILAGLAAYKDKGPDEAVKAWIKGSPMDGNKEALGEAGDSGFLWRLSGVRFFEHARFIAKVASNLSGP